MTRLSLCAAVAVAAIFLPVVNAGTLTGLTGDLDLLLNGQTVTFSPTGGNNATIEADFAAATMGVPVPAELLMLDLGSTPTVFQHGTYIPGLQLEPLTHSLGHVTVTGPGTFSSSFGVFFAITFNFTGAGSSDGSGDVLGEFGSLPGISNCINGAVSTCELHKGIVVSGNFETIGNTLSNVALSATPEPGTIWLGGLALLLLGRLRKK
jgi:hypothetical protein